MKSIAQQDFIQKTWVPEGTKEYTLFKLATQENARLVEEIKRAVDIGPGELVLDVGGRDGNVAFEVQDPKWVHIVDPDPTIKLGRRPSKFWNKKVQEIAFPPRVKYKLIICCHVMGYLGFQDAQREVLKKLTDMLEVGGTLVLFYNLNIGYVGELLDYSRHVLPAGHYDFFDEGLLQEYRIAGYRIKKTDASFRLDFENLKQLARCCWFLFGSISSNIEENIKRFMPKLLVDLQRPSLVIDERILFITKQEQSVLMPTFR